MTRRAVTALLLAAFLAGCASLEPKLPEARPEIAREWPLPPTTSAVPASAGPGAAGRDIDSFADIGWRDFFADPKLEQLIASALEHNRDLRVAVLNVQRAQALYRVQRSERVPAVGASASMARYGGGNAALPDVYSVGIGITDFELDLFGRVRNLSEAALQQYFAQEETRRSAQLALVGEVASAYLTLAADRELLRVAQATLENQEAAYGLTVKRHDYGAVSGLDLSQARTTVESARADEARYAGQVAQDTDALVLLVGTQVDPALLPEGLTAVSVIAPVPAGLPSEVLLRRPDVIAAEHTLRAANANIGAARAAFFPAIQLTGSVGTASQQLSGLFRSGSFAWSFTPGITLPIFQGGRLRANLDVTKSERDIALAQYEKSIQSGFREVADALALSRTLAARVAAQQALLAAAAEADKLSQARYDAGRDSYLVLLDSQRALYAARQGLVAARLAEQANRVALYKVLGGGWK